MRNGLLHRLINNFDDHDVFFNKVAPSGYTIAVNIHNLTPEFYHTTLPYDWIEKYTNKRFFLVDPVMQFALVGQGIKKWSDITALKIPIASSRFMANAADYELNFGLAVVRLANVEKRAKNLLSLARSDRELSDDEIVESASRFEQILSTLNPGHYLSKRQINLLVLFANGETRSSAAKHLAVSEETVKKDIEAIRSLWGAKNVTEAVGIAIARKIITPYSNARW